ncbi:amidohydrolase [Clostridium neuense]
MVMKAEILLRSKNIFTAVNNTIIDGHVAIAGGKILSVGEGDGSEFLSRETKVYELGSRVICPGFSDVHCFFTGYVLKFVGIDLSKASFDSLENVITHVKEYAAANPSKKLILGHGWNSKVIAPDITSLDNEFPDTPVVLFAEGGDTCLMNTAAINTYKFTPDTCYPEAYWRLLKDIISDREFIVPEFKKYMAMMNGRGITSVKEMGFDDFYGFTDVLEDLDKSGELTLRVNFMSQPVGRCADFEYGKAMRKRFVGDFVRFSGYNRMTDGSISELCGDLKKPYNCADTCCALDIDYDMIEKETLAADAAGFRFSLHAQGDAAICKVLNIYEKCQKDNNGKLKNRHSMTDLEFSDPADLEHMGKLGVIAEIYPQIQSIADRKSKLAMIESKIGMDRGKYYWNRRKMADSGVILSCGTDLPLLIDNIPESIYHACGGFFPEGGEPFNVENTLTINEVLTAWTRGGAYDLFQEEKLGTLEAGKTADIAVLSDDVFKIPLSKIRNVNVCLTLVNGKEVYNSIQ